MKTVEHNRIVQCVVCCRQVVSYNANDEHIVGAEGAKAAIGGVFCVDCGADLDENGLFPEECSSLIRE